MRNGGTSNKTTQAAFFGGLGKATLRWALVIPAAVGAYFGVQIAIALVNGLQDFFWSTGSDRWTQLVNSIAGPCAFVWYGARTAPKFRAVVAACLAALITEIMVILFAFVCWCQTEKGFEFWWLAGALVVGVIASVVSAAAVHDRENVERKAALEQTEGSLKELSNHAKISDYITPDGARIA